MLQISLFETFPSSSKCDTIANAVIDPTSFTGDKRFTFSCIRYLSNSEGSDLLLASSHLIRNEIYIVDELPKILAKSANRINDAQIQSVLTLMNRIGTLESPLNDEQKKLITGVETFYAKRKMGNVRDKW